MAREKTPRISFTEERITPEIAARYLAMNLSVNRNLSEKNTTQLANEIRRGEWKLTHQGCAFNKEGFLIDGQHRLEAIIRSGVAVEMIVARWLVNDSESFTKFDIGKRRSNADLYINIGGDRQYAERKTAVGSALLSGITNRRDFSRDDIGAYVITHGAEIEKYVKIAVKARKGLYKATIVAAFVKASLQFGDDIIEPILSRLIDEKWTSRRDPLRILSDRVVGKTVARDEVYGLTVSAIRHAIEQSEPGQLKSSVEDFSEEKMRLPKAFSSISEFLEEKKFVREMYETGSREASDYPARWLADPIHCSACKGIRLRFTRSDGGFISPPEGKCSKCFGRGTGHIDLATAVRQNINPWDNPSYMPSVSGAERAKKRERIEALIASKRADMKGAM